MKKAMLIIATVAALVLGTFAQQPMASRFGGRYWASNYNRWSVQMYIGNAATGSQTITLANGLVSLPDGRNISPFATNAPITINDGTNTETVTPTAVSNCNSPQSYQCLITASFSNTHGAGVQIYVSSGTAGLQEAINDARENGNGAAVVDGTWSGTTAMLSAASLVGSYSHNGQTYNSPPGLVEDLRTVPEYWVAKPSAVTLISAPSAPTVNVTTGSLSSGAYRAMAAYVDCGGGVSAASTDSTQTATTTGLIITSPAAATGACGWLPYITAAGGGTGTEILAKATIDSTICTLSTLESVVPSCAIGQNATITAANPSSTAKPMVEPNAFSTWGAVPINNEPLPFVSVYPFGVFTATATLNNSNADAAQFQTPAGFFNFLGKAWDVCFKGATATQVASSIITVNLNVATQYAQSPVTVSAIAFPTQTQAAAGTFEGCVRLTTSTIGSSGKFWAASALGPAHNFLNTAPGTQVVSADASAAQSSAIDLTKQLWWSINLAGTGAANITVPIINSVSILPVQ